MLAHALIVASAALVAAQGEPYPPNMTIPLYTDTGIYFDISTSTGAIGVGSSCAFNTYGMISVNSEPYFTQEPAFLIDGRTVATGPMMTGSGLIVHRKIYVPPVPHRLRPGQLPSGYARFLDTITNPTTTTQMALVQFWGRIGSNGLAKIIRTPTHPDNTAAPLTPEDYYAVISDRGAFDVMTPVVGVLFEYKRFARTQPSDSIFYADGLFSTAYFVTIPPGSKVRLVNFVVQVWPDFTPPQSATLAQDAYEQAFNETEQQLQDLTKDPDFDGMSPEEKMLWNFFIDTDVNIDGRVNILDLISVRNDITKTPETAQNPRCDVNHDLIINIIDLIIVRNDLGWPY